MSEKNVQISISEALRDALREEKGDATYTEHLHKLRDGGLAAVMTALLSPELVDQCRRNKSPAFTLAKAQELLYGGGTP